jgi:hypothetical protein
MLRRSTETDSLSAPAETSVRTPSTAAFPSVGRKCGCTDSICVRFEQLLESHCIPDGSALGSGDVNQDLSEIVLQLRVDHTAPKS